MSCSVVPAMPSQSPIGNKASHLVSPRPIGPGCVAALTAVLDGFVDRISTFQQPADENHIGRQIVVGNQRRSGLVAIETDAEGLTKVFQAGWVTKLQQRVGAGQRPAHIVFRRTRPTGLRRWHARPGRGPLRCDPATGDGRARPASTLATIADGSNPSTNAPARWSNSIGRFGIPPVPLQGRPGRERIGLVQGKPRFPEALPRPLRVRQLFHPHDRWSPGRTPAGHRPDHAGLPASSAAR